MKLIRNLSTRTLVLVSTLVIVAASGTTLAVAASRGGGPPPPKPLAQAVHDALAAPSVEGVTARIAFTNRLFPSGSIVGNLASALMSGATGRVWLTADGRGRLELKSNAGDVQLVWNRSTVTLYDTGSNTAYRATLPARFGTEGPAALPSIAQIQGLLDELGAKASVSGAEPTTVAGRPAYRVVVAPKHDGGLLGSAQLVWDAVRGVPLRVGVYAQGSSSPVLELTATEIEYGPVADSAVDVAPPAGAKVVDIGAIGADHPGERGAPDTGVSGLPAVQAKAPFPVVAPDTLVGLPRRDVRLLGSDTVVAVYGRGLGAIVVVERKADASAESDELLRSLPTVALDGVTAHELATQLGTVLTWERGGVSTILAGSLPPAAAEAAARAMR